MEITLGNAMCTQTKGKGKCASSKDVCMWQVGSGLQISEHCPVIANALIVNNLKMRLDNKLSSYTVGVFYFSTFKSINALNILV